MSIVTTTGLLAFLQLHGYVIMFIIMVAEGAIVTYVSAFLASLGIFNVFIVLGLSSLGNIAGDMILYYSGRRWGRKFLAKHFYRRSRGKRLKKLAGSIKRHPGKMITLIKISPFIPIPGLMLIGASNVPMKKFFTYSVVVSVVYSLVFTLLGFYSGVAFNAIAKGISKSDYVIAVAALLGMIIYYIIRYISSMIEKKAENQK